MTFVLAVVVFVTSFILDAAATRYVQVASVQCPTTSDAHRAARYSCLMWAMSMVGTVLVLKVDLWLAIAEVAGLYAGSYYAARSRKAAAPVG